MNHNGRDAVVFYSLGNFAMPTNRHGKHLCAPMGLYTYKDAFYRELEPGHKPEIFTRFWLEGGVARIEAGKNGLERVTFVPTQAKSLESGQPRPLSTRDAGFRKVVTHMKWASEGLRGAPEFKVRNNEIQIYQC
jgi:hypothetical protein